MKLDGIRVLDLSSFLPGPYLTLAMADHGADIIKVEMPGEGDPGRHIAPQDGDHTVFFRNLNRGKKSVVLNLKEARDRDTLLSMVETADVFIESFRPGVAARLGIGADVVRARNPRIVYCSISAFGQAGPYAGRPAHDLALEALSGLLSNTVDAAGAPVAPGIPVADVVAGLHGLGGVLMALLARERTGKGDRIDISMHDSLIGAMLNILGPPIAEDRAPDPREERITGGSAFYRIYATADGRRLVLAAQEMKFVRTLLDHLGRPDLAAPCERGPGRHQQPVIDYLTGEFGRRTLDEASAMLGALDVGWAPVKNLKDALADENLHERGTIVVDAEGRRHIASPIRFDDDPARPSFDVPALDEHAALAEAFRKKETI